MMGRRLCGERFVATYLIEGPADEAAAWASKIAVEQSVELPTQLIEDAWIREEIIGRVEGIASVAPALHQARISFASELAGGELTQLLNVLFGNTSLKPNVRLVDFELPPVLAGTFRGPRFGLPGLRDRLGVHDRPFLVTAIKPMGLPPEALAELAAQFARGGIDIVKDDHGLADQPFCRFSDRVVAVARAVEQVNREAGTACVYAPNVTAAPLVAHKRARLAKSAGAGALLLSPGLAGWDTLRMLADDDDLALPIICHPAFLAIRGAYSHRVLYGRLPRLAGADATIFPSYGGRFAFTAEECRDLCAGALEPMAGLRSCVPLPAGGITLERLPGQLAFYGADTGLLIGGDLLFHGDVASTCRRCRDLIAPV
jgi:ribulose-bisphosphate carboxylase large chain